MVVLEEVANADGWFLTLFFSFPNAIRIVSNVPESTITSAVPVLTTPCSASSTNSPKRLATKTVQPYGSEFLLTCVQSATRTAQFVTSYRPTVLCVQQGTSIYPWTAPAPETVP